MTKQAKNCSHPQMCADQDLFKEKIKTQKLALEPLPASEVIKTED